MLSTKDRDFIRLLLRSPDNGDGWRIVSGPCWQFVEEFGSHDLIEADKLKMRVRLTADGLVVAKYAL